MHDHLRELLMGPLVAPGTPADPPDDAARALAERLGVVYAAVRVGAPDAAHRLRLARTEVYRQASTTWDDPWRLTRVAEIEELCAEQARRAGDLAEAWATWRSAWWIRRLLDGRLERSGRRLAEDAHPARCRADLVMAALHAAVGRDAEARERLDELAAHPGEAELARAALPRRS